ncbi:GRF1-interacting factor 1-like isoform X2 [Ananas comosus]|uniref:GRF1-interacting factor 1-like isoform X2 n=2 Tax=Ananas comosus TaxID=4615 RepID=A0A6P5EA74_ANACO|nr:GRF1-interacting factor 1-like isoform X2 [Ananas comosus]
MQQHLMQMNQNMMGGYASPTTVTTDLIQQYLDQNKQLILAILDNQNTGKVEECARNQAKLQHNLMYLAAIADSQPPQASAMAQGVTDEIAHYSNTFHRYDCC